MREERIAGGGVLVEREVPCRLRDGVTLYADVYRPEGAGPHPVLLMREPYNKWTAQTGSGYNHPSWWARRGYLTVVQDCRGRHRSEGEFVPFAHEAVDGYDAIEWAAQLPGADGRVAMYGFSYPGATQLLAASERPPSLVAICPAMTSSQFSDGWTYEGGALSLAFVASWAAGLAWDTALRAGDEELMAAFERALADRTWLATLPLERLDPLTRRNAPYFFDWIEHESDDGYWRATSIDEDVSRIAVPALHVGGWYDIFLRGTVRSFVSLRAGAGSAEARARQKLLVGPWQHGPWKPLFGAGEDAGPLAVNEWQLRFLDEVVRDRPSGVFDAPVTAYVLGEGWRDLDGWPPSEAREIDWFLHSGGRAGSRFGDGTLSPAPPGDEPADAFAYDPLAPVASAGGHSCCDEASAPMGPRSQAGAEQWGDVLVYTSEPLAEELVLLGDVAVTLFAASTAVDTDFTARLCTVDPEGESVNVTEGIVRARYRESLRVPAPLEPGRVYEFGIGLGPVAVRIPAGHRLRLNVSSSDFPHWDRNLNTGGPLGKEGRAAAIVAMQTVLHDGAHPSRVTLPVAGRAVTTG